MRVFRYLWLLAIVALLVAIGLLAAGFRSQTGPAVLVMLTALAFAAAGHESLRSFAFTFWVFVFVAASLFYPLAFGVWFGFDLKFLIVPLIQIIMFGMGTTLSMHDFGRVFTMPRPVLIGMALQFSVMPLLGLAIATLFGFQPEVAAGVVLIGSCPGGVASNLMTFLAGGDVALSVTMTSCSTMVSPVMTPLLMEKLAGRFIDIEFLAMMVDILNLIIAPIVAGLIANRILYSGRRVFGRAAPLAAMSAVGLVVSWLVYRAAPESLGPLAGVKSGLAVGLVMIAAVAAAKLVVELWCRGQHNWMDRTLPMVSMSGICFIIAIITARSSEKLLTIGLALVAAAMVHNLLGYVLGYWLARLARLNERYARTIAFEVGMQNGGMASSLAMYTLNSANAALAPAIFGPWMNISGSVLASWWRRRPTSDGDGPGPDHEREPSRKGRNP